MEKYRINSFRKISCAHAYLTKSIPTDLLRDPFVEEGATANVTDSLSKLLNISGRKEN